jgi:hypothetical protein
MKNIFIKKISFFLIFISINKINSKEEHNNNNNNKETAAYLEYKRQVNQIESFINENEDGDPGVCYNINDQVQKGQKEASNQSCNRKDLIKVIQKNKTLSQEYAARNNDFALNNYQQLNKIQSIALKLSQNQKERRIIRQEFTLGDSDILLLEISLNAANFLEYYITNYRNQKEEYLKQKKEIQEIKADSEKKINIIQKRIENIERINTNAEFRSPLNENSLLLATSLPFKISNLFDKAINVIVSSYFTISDLELSDEKHIVEKGLDIYLKELIPAEELENLIETINKLKINKGAPFKKCTIEKIKDNVARWLKNSGEFTDILKKKLNELYEEQQKKNNPQPKQTPNLKDLNQKQEPQQNQELPNINNLQFK